MESSFKDMDNFVSHWGAFTRKFPSLFQVQTIGYIPRKTDWVKSTFQTCNFSFILSGGGEYWREEKLYRVQTPCVITQWSGEPLRYGPSGEFTSWEELYLIYRAEMKQVFTGRKLIDGSRPAWPIVRPRRWREVVDEMLLVGRQPKESEADRIDRLCERLILESLLHQSESEIKTREAGLIDRARETMAGNLRQPLDLTVAAKSVGMSEQTFRRHWMKQVGIPPGQYVTQMKMKEACQLLVETDLSVGEIAEQLGYEDPLYFSRKFQQRFHIPATRYRKMNQI